MKMTRKLMAVVTLFVAISATAALPVVCAAQDAEGQKQERPRKLSEAPSVKVEKQATVGANVVEVEKKNADDEAAQVGYYANHLSTYLLGPEDVISITVFGLDRYTKTGIIIPPDGRIDYYFIKEGLMAAGKTTRQVAEEITKHLDEYIIDPKVTVSLEKAVSQRYGVVGDVGKPGVFVMSRRISAYEALNEAGGVLATGDKKKVVVLHWTADRVLKPVPIDVSAIEKGRAPDNYFLKPGDQIFVPGNKFKKVDKILSYLPIISFARIFTGGF
jgi:polysaccharide export outer membrane protein